MTLLFDQQPKFATEMTSDTPALRHQRIRRGASCTDRIGSISILRRRFDHISSTRYRFRNLASVHLQLKLCGSRQPIKSIAPSRRGTCCFYVCTTGSERGRSTVKTWHSKVRFLSLPHACQVQANPGVTNFQGHSLKMSMTHPLPSIIYFPSST